MSLLSRVSAPLATHDLAATVTILLSNLDRAAAPGRSPGPAGRPTVIAPTGLGTSAARIAAPTAPTALAPPRPTGGGQVPELYCPPAVRDDPALGEHVNLQLVDWAERVGVYSGQLDRLRAANFGRLLMLTHPDTDDPDRLLAAGKCALAEWAVDDHYCDDESAGADPERLGPRLAIATAAVDPAHLPSRYAPELERALRSDPVLVALRSSLDHAARYASWAQVARLRHEIAALFVGFGAEAGWRTAARMPPVWEYLTTRQANSFLPCLALIDAVGGYELASATYACPRVRRAVAMAAIAATLVNDLYSLAKEQDAAGLDFNLPTVIAAEERCSLPAAVERSVEIHDELVHGFEEAAAAASLTGSPALRRFLAGVWAWLGGNREWHRSTDRYLQPA
ncbi:MAG: Camphene synthase [Micromonosporaceae bacterium]|nr:Camphene synthase [Micromonosporaceae bacterium]